MRPISEWIRIDWVRPSSIITSMGIADWLLVLASGAVFGFACFTEPSEFISDSRQEIRPKIAIIYKLPPKVKPDDIDSISNDKIVNDLKVALELERLKNMSLKSEIEGTRNLIEEIFLASKSTMLALNEGEEKKASKNAVHLDIDQGQVPDVKYGIDDKDDSASPRQPAAIPAPRPLNLVPSIHQSESKITMAQNSNSPVNELVIGSKSLPLRAKQNDVKKLEKNTTNTELVSPEIEKTLAGFKLRPIEQGFLVIVPGIDLFSQNSREITANALDILKPIADAAQINDDMRLEVVAHTDGFKSVDESKKLSQQRARSIRDLLADQLNVNANRITAIGKGKDEPIASNATFDGRQINRRIEILFLK